ncbi:MAG: transcriptional repressor LexA [candidate division WWE3 bacterium]|nr:transcriptional repressor LexA [candidate division WWE3 bacterium]
MPPTTYRRQKEVLDFVSQYIQKYGSSPTLQEIASALGLSSLATVHQHLEALEKKGLIKKFDGNIRGFEVINEVITPALEGVEVPIIGYIAAGKPIEAIESPLDTIRISASMLSGKKRAFVLQVRGESMINDGILDGDFVVCEQQQTANNGDIVVALINGATATLKRYYKEKDRIRLQPANDTMKPIYVKNVKIQGKVVGVIRRY